MQVVLRMLTYADGGERVGRSSLSLSHVSVSSSAQADSDELVGGGMRDYSSEETNPDSEKQKENSSFCFSKRNPFIGND